MPNQKNNKKKTAQLWKKVCGPQEKRKSDVKSKVAAVLGGI